MPELLLSETVVPAPLVSHHVGTAFDMRFDKSMEGLCVRDFYLPRPNLTSSFHKAEYWRLAYCTSAEISSLVLVFVLFLSTNVSFIGLDNALQEGVVLYHGFAHSHEHEPRRVFVYFNVSGELPCADSFLGIENECDSKKPLLHVYFTLMENSSDRSAERGLAVVAMMPMFLRKGTHAERLAVRALCLPVPSDRFNVRSTVLLCWKTLVKLDDVHMGIYYFLYVGQFSTRRNSVKRGCG